ncbi:VOC family protein [Arthrobacter sp. NicSoilB8]|uniref:VOC family protein n=1 Tax=Arthrobacter sp. NicSoilB8 TaxID=2830998 RepID=UPI001CC72453|nr:VOC family protein [Arthrobacter sp. NicSoilB8]BCW71159.1 hypothetical protein NicSoilB8_22030 [Arthrobacter sp. NicSoilB8]
MAEALGTVESQDTAGNRGSVAAGHWCRHPVVEDLAVAKSFYQDIFRLLLIFEDDVSAVFKFANTLINLLDVDEAAGLIEPTMVAKTDSGARFQFTIEVDEVDVICAKLSRRGADLSAPMDRLWGIRTSSFRDPPDVSGKSPPRNQAGAATLDSRSGGHVRRWKGWLREGMPSPGFARWAQAHYAPSSR